MSDCGSRFEAAAFLSHSQTKSMSARSFVQDSGARSWALRIGRRRRSQRKGRLCSLHFTLLASLAEAGAREPLPSSLARRLARSSRTAARQPCSVRRRAIPTLAAGSKAARAARGDVRLIDQTERPNRVTLLAEFGHTGVDLAAGKVVDLQPRHDLVCAAGYRACE